MIRTESPANRAYWHLADLVRSDSSGDLHQLFALTWLAAGRMVAAGHVKGVSNVGELVDPAIWKALREAGFPSEAHDAIVSQRFIGIAHDESRRTRAAAIVGELVKELGLHRWDILECLTDSTSHREEASGTVAPELASLLMDMLKAPPASEVWIPFDPKGQLTIEALRRGWNVLASSPLPGRQLIRQLLLTIETGYPQPRCVRTELRCDAIGRPLSRADYALVIPPFGMSLKDGRVALWDVTGTRASEKYTRSESWALFEFVNRVEKRAVFATPQGVLFAKGQEQRLREYLLNRGRERVEVEAVIALPPGLFGASAIAGAVIVVTPGGDAETTYMADLGSGRRSLLEAGAIVYAGRDLAFGRAQSERGRLVSREEISANEFSFAPSRYLSRLANLDDTVAKLGDICTIIRPPATTKETHFTEVAEVGLANLENWKPISGDVDKTVFLKTQLKEDSLLRPDDIVLSIKGTVGRAALVGDTATRRPTVVSQSCVALRLSTQPGRTLPPEVLLMYLRSPHGQAQLAGLQVGVGVQHISPVTLMNSVSVPLPSYQVCMEIQADYAKLCDLEHQIAGLKHAMTEITWRRWPDEIL